MNRSIILLLTIAWIALFMKHDVSAKSLHQPTVKTSLQKFLDGKLYRSVDQLNTAITDKELDLVADTTLSETSMGPSVLRLFLLFTTWYAFNAGCKFSDKKKKL